MTLNEVLANEAVANGDSWFRPVIWAGTGAALCVQRVSKYTPYPRVLVVPSAHGGTVWKPLVTELTGKWVIVSPNEVNAETDTWR